MNPIVDAIMLTLFVLFMIWLVHGFVRTQHDKMVQKIEEQESEQKKSDD
jgi:flagellar biogenesis protein FliO